MALKSKGRTVREKGLPSVLVPTKRGAEQGEGKKSVLFLFTTQRFELQSRQQLLRALYAVVIT